jgi:hypothetical protein
MPKKHGCASNVVLGGSKTRPLSNSRRFGLCADEGSGRGFTDFENFSVFKPGPGHEKSVNELFHQVIAWGGALKALRERPA